MARGRNVLLALLVVTAVAGAGVASLALDGDGVGVERELEAGTDPTAADTDGDGLDDGAELSGPTDPTVADTDGDGLADGAEVREYGSDATGAHSDDDDLADGLEAGIGTDPTDVDTDGDRLLDHWEHRNRTDDGVALPDADPTAMDLYVVVGVSAGVSGLENYSALEAAFAEMPVENPDGSTGIDLHVVQVRRFDETIRLEDRSVSGRVTADFDRIERQYARPLLGERRGVYRALLFIDFYQPMGLAIGWGEVPGDLSVANGNFDEDVKRRIAVHELLHNVFGVLETDERCPDDPSHYCGPGWLNGTVTGSDTFLPEPLADELEREGFEPTDGG